LAIMSGWWTGLKEKAELEQDMAEAEAGRHIRQTARAGPTLVLTPYCHRAAHISYRGVKISTG
jgi:hypothetical protein